MPRPSNEVLIKRLGECAADLAAVSRDDDYSGQNIVLIHKALPVFMKREAESARFVVVARIENFSKAQQKWGTDWLYGAIRRAVNVRAPQVLIRSRWIAENEVVFILSGDPQDFCNKLRTAIKNEGLNSLIAFVPYSGHVTYDHDRAAETFAPVITRS